MFAAAKWTMAAVGALLTAGTMLLVSCDSLDGAVKSVPAADRVVAAIRTAGQYNAITTSDVDRLVQAVIDLQCAPASVHAQVVAERDAAQALAVQRSVEIETLREVHRQQDVDLWAEHHAEIESMGAQIDAHAAAYHAALARAEAAEAALAEVQAVFSGMTVDVPVDTE